MNQQTQTDSIGEPRIEIRDKHEVRLALSHLFIRSLAWKLTRTIFLRFCNFEARVDFRHNLWGFLRKEISEMREEVHLTHSLEG